MINYLSVAKKKKYYLGGDSDIGLCVGLLIGLNVFLQRSLSACLGVSVVPCLARVLSHLAKALSSPPNCSWAANFSSSLDIWRAMISSLEILFLSASLSKIKKKLDFIFTLFYKVLYLLDLSMTLNAHFYSCNPATYGLVIAIYVFSYIGGKGILYSL